MTPMFNAVSFIFLLQLARCTTTCPKQCRCKGTDIFCHERELKAVPHPIPSDYIKLYLQGNDLGISELRMGLHEHKQLQVLDLANNKLREFPLELPECLHNLKLQDNDIPFSDLKNLQIISLKENRFTLILSENELSNLTLILWNNPWICDCRLLWLKKRMLKNSVITIGLKCGTPASLRNKYFKNIGAKELCSMTTTPLPPTTTTTITTKVTETFSTDDPSVFVMETTAMSTLASTVMMTHLSTLSGDLKVVIQSYARKNTIVVQWNNTKADAMYKLHWQKIGDPRPSLSWFGSF
uniref:LRRNT domain-containing protein n=1 Tax=Eptatretus burgeri TaxID=7764 RepID=A0A8C4Q1B4_EPTBU